MKWTPELDRKLLAAVKAGESRRAWARANRVSENATIARYNRLSGVVFPSDLERTRLTREKSAERKKSVSALEKKQLGLMKKKISQGADRRTAMREANKAGVRYEAIGRCLGISRQAAQQYVEYEGA